MYTAMVAIMNDHQITYTNTHIKVIIDGLVKHDLRQ
jgi:hypothetical protein